MTRAFHYLIAGCLLLLMTLSLASATEIYDRIPGNSLGFVVIRDLQQASEKAEELMLAFGSAAPAPLTLAKAVTGLDEGIDTSGSLAVAMLPSSKSGGDNQPFVLLPISDYQEFAEAVHADASGEICRISLLGEDILVAQVDQYAVLMNKEHQSTLETLVPQRWGRRTELTQFEPWISTQDVSLVVMPAGLQHVAEWKEQPKRKFDFLQNAHRRQSLLAQWTAPLIGAAGRGWLNDNVQIAAIGVTVDSQANLRVGKRLLLKKGSALAGLSVQSLDGQSAMLGLSAEPCVLTAGGPLPKGWDQSFSTYLSQLEKSQAATSGLQNVSSELWDKNRNAYHALIDQVSSCSFVMLPGEKGDPLVGNFFGLATVPNVDKYFAGLPQIATTWNEITKKSTSDLKPTFELQEKQIAGRSGRELVVDVATTARDPNVPAFNWMLEAAFGVEGKLRVKFLKVNDTQFLFGFATDEQMQTVVDTIENGDPIQPVLPTMQGTFQLLDPDATWKALVQPQGCIFWASRVANEFFGMIGFNQAEMEVPELPDSPPVGITANGSGRLWHVEIVCPANTCSMLGEYFNTLEEF